MLMLGWLIAFIVVLNGLAYHQASRQVWFVGLTLFFVFLSTLGAFSWVSLTIIGALFLMLFLFWGVSSWRYKWFTQRIFAFYQKVMPSMSSTESDALAAGTVAWEKELFQGAPDWNTLLALPAPFLTEEEKAFLEGPVETLCGMIDDWEITRYRLDLPKEVWQYLKKEGFFALIIPVEYGGKGFSAYAHSQILTKIYGRSATVGTTVAVPNSLGPAELLLHYGTPEQKNYYLPRLAGGEELPCFALTGPEAGSDAGAMTDKGVVCWGEHQGKKVLGIRLNFNKRYITLAPVATVIGLAFKLYDPDHLLGDKKQIGITCALIPRETPGVHIGRRHFPVNIPFQNGPILGKDVFIPMEWIIGGPSMAGKGWQMLMECLAAGRGISLPASSMGGAKILTYASGAYARIRRQFNVAISSFEGIEEVLARLAGYTYLMDATRTFTAILIDQGEKPALASSITKYHLTELGRKVSNDAMDLHGGKGICLGPRNYTARIYEAVPIAITVEGANILTRSMIIFGQGLMRCHPFIFAEYHAAKEPSLSAFDKALLGHLGYGLSCLVRTFWLNFTDGRIAKVPPGQGKRFFQHASRLSAAFALLSEICLLIFRGSLKRKESISARLGDILSYLYMLSAVLKHFHHQGKPAEDVSLMQWTSVYCLYHIEQRFDEVIRNLPKRTWRILLRFLFFPFGKRFTLPPDGLTQEVSELIKAPTGARYRLAEGAFLANTPNNMLSVLEEALGKVIAAEPVEKIIKLNLPSITKKTLEEQAHIAFAQQIISKEQFDAILAAEMARRKVIAVDDFAPEEMTRGY